MKIKKHRNFYDHQNSDIDMDADTDSPAITEID